MPLLMRNPTAAGLPVNLPGTGKVSGKKRKVKLELGLLNGLHQEVYV